MTYAKLGSKKEALGQWPLQLGAVLLALPLLFLTGCDSGGNGDNNQNLTDFQKGLVNYDTTSAGIRFNESDGDDNFGVVPEDPAEVGNSSTARDSYVKWTKAKGPYFIDGRTFVNPGDTLEIEPGTVIKGISNQSPSNASALIVSRGGVILADGTKSEPIIFTAGQDDVGKPNDVASTARGLWGGVLILGDAPGNWPDGDPRQIEGIPSDVTRARYGAKNGSGDPGDDSGVFSYVQIKYGGISIGAGNEINGLSLAAVGTGTQVDHVEVYNNQDDGIEFFGGTVNAKYLVTSRVGDDGFDIDQGYSGNLQYLLSIQDTKTGGRSGEHDSGDDDYGGADESDAPVADPQIANATYIGSGLPDGQTNNVTTGQGGRTLQLRDNFAGDYYNSVFWGYPAGFILVEDKGVSADSETRWDKGELTVNNSFVYNFGSADSLSSPTQTQQFGAIVDNTDGSDNLTSHGQKVRDDLVNNLGNEYKDPGFASRMLNAALSPVDVTPTSNVTSGSLASLPSSGGFFDSVSYRGAFAPGGPNWAATWTASDENGLFQ